MRHSKSPLSRTGAPDSDPPHADIPPWSGSPDLAAGEASTFILTVHPAAAGFVLAGGRSSRMGTDKALVQLNGKSLIVHSLGILRAAGLNPSIAGARSSLESFAPIVPDSQPDQGPLGGICSALASSSARWAVFLTVDLPLIPPNLIAYLLDKAAKSEAPVTVASFNGFAQTFPAVLARAALPALESELEAGRRGCLAAFKSAATALGKSISVLSVEEALASRELGDHGNENPDRWFLNLNAPEDLRRAKDTPRKI